MLEQVGPEFYDDASLREAIGASEGDPVPEGSVLALRTADERWIYPTWQVRDAAVLPGLAEVLTAFAGHPAWSVALWLTTAHHDLDGSTPAAWLAADGDLGRVVDLAAATSERWR